MDEIEIVEAPMLPQSETEENEEFDFWEEFNIEEENQNSYGGYPDDTADKRMFDEFAMEYIREKLSEMFFLEGKNRDYYFGKSPLNKGLTVFYNNSHVGESICGVVKGIAPEFWKTNLKHSNFEVNNTTSWSLQKTGFNLSGVRYTCYFYQRYDDMRQHQCLSYNINVLEPNVLEEAIEREPERWALYQKVVNGK